MKIELDLKEKHEKYLAETGDIVKDKDGDLYLVVSGPTGMCNLLGLTYGKGDLLYHQGRKRDELTVNGLSVELVKKSSDVVMEIKTKGEQ